MIRLSNLTVADDRRPGTPPLGTGSFGVEDCVGSRFAVGAE